MSRRELANPLEGRVIGKRRPEREHVGDSDRVELAPRGRMAEERLGLRGKAEVASEPGEEQRPHAESVAREEELPPLAIPDRDGEVAVEPA